MSPHKILLKEESKEVILDPQPKLEAEETLEQVPKQTKIKSKVKRKLNDNQSLNKDSPQNHKLTEYFTVRRSVRKPKNVLLEEKQRHLEEIVLSEREDGLKVVNKNCICLSKLRSFTNFFNSNIRFMFSPVKVVE